MRISGWAILLLTGVVNITAQTESFAKCIENCLRNGGDDDCITKECRDLYDVETLESYENPLSDSPSDSVSNPNKRYGNFVRIGRSRNAFVRIGKATPKETANDEKRQSSFLRIGKSPCDKFADQWKHLCLRVGKSAEPNAIEESSSNVPEEDEKRAANSFLRIGRGSAFLRIGKKSEPEKNVSKRFGAFLRIGKAPVSSFLRIGKTPYSKGQNSFLRIGRPSKSAFLRIGKRETLGDSNTSNDKANSPRVDGSLAEAKLDFVKDIPEGNTQKQ